MSKPKNRRSQTYISYKTVWTNLSKLCCFFMSGDLLCMSGFLNQFKIIIIQCFEVSTIKVFRVSSQHQSNGPAHKKKLNSNKEFGT